MNEINNTPSSRPNMAQRIFAGIVALASTTFALLVFRTQLLTGFDPIGAILGTGAATIATLCWWFALHGHNKERRNRMRFAIQGGLILGGIGFIAGFIGPIILQPDANQGPLLGILVTGPLGFTLGAMIGWIYARFFSERRSQK